MLNRLLIFAVFSLTAASLFGQCPTATMKVYQDNNQTCTVQGVTFSLFGVTSYATGYKIATNDITIQTDGVSIAFVSNKFSVTSGTLSEVINFRATGTFTNPQLYLPQYFSFLGGLVFASADWTNDYVNLNQLITAWQSNGGVGQTVFTLPGTYVMSNTVVQVNLVLTGAGSGGDAEVSEVRFTPIS